MAKFSRRALLAGAFAFGVLGLSSKSMHAAVFRAMTLEALVRASHRVIVALPLAAECHYEDVGSGRRIVTDTRVLIEEVIYGSKPQASECIVRTLGGIVGEVGERVSGQAALRVEQRAVAFLVDAGSEVSFVVGMAQGHFPLLRSRDGVPRLIRGARSARELPVPSPSAAERLVGRSLDEARHMIVAVSR